MTLDYLLGYLEHWTQTPCFQEQRNQMQLRDQSWLLLHFPKSADQSFHPHELLESQQNHLTRPPLQALP